MNTRQPLLLLATLPLNAAAQAQRPNIVYIMTDDHTAQMLSAYDTTNIRTPNLDRIAARGVRFTNSYVANSLSGPSRACMLTGKHSHKNGFTNNEHGIFDGTQQTMPKLLRQAGYTTALIGKWHLVSTPTGFDHYEILPAQGDYYNPTFIHQDGTAAPDSGYVTTLITNKAIAYLQQHQATHPNKPFALFVHHKACHRAWLPDLQDLHLYEDHQFPLPTAFTDTYQGRPAAAATEMEIGKDMDIVYDTKHYHPTLAPTTPLTAPYLRMIGRLSPEERARYDAFYQPLAQDFYTHHPDPTTYNPRASHVTGNPEATQILHHKYQRYMRDYAKVVASLDREVGRLLDYLEEQGLTQNTLIVYTSDQGFYMGEHGYFDKRFAYEESLRTPLLMSLPQGLDRRGDINEMVQNIDYAPTFLDLAQAPIPPDIQGRSLLPLLKGRQATRADRHTIRHWRDAIYYHYYEYPAEHAVRRHYAIRTTRYKLIHYYGHDIDTWELYDLHTDPHELHNLYGLPAYATLQAHLHRRLEHLQVEYEDDVR